MPTILTRERVAIYCSALLIAALALQVFSYFRGRPFGEDFAVFYAEAKIAFNYPHRELYSLELHDKEYSAIMGSNRSSPFAYMPWFTLPIAPLAALPYNIAFGLWTVSSLGLLFVGIQLLRNSATRLFGDSVLVMLACAAFPPFLFYTLLNGQASALGFFILCLSFFLQTRGKFLVSGLVLSFLSYKPTLLVFWGPMLLVTKQWRLLAGLIIGTIALLGLSVLWAGTAAFGDYIHLMSLYRQVLLSPVEAFQTEKYVDVVAASRLVFGSLRIPIWIVLSVALAFACLVWYRVGPKPLSWSLAALFGLVLNTYSPIYDCTLLIFVVVLAGVSTLPQTLIAALYLVPAITVAVAKWTRIQIYSLVLIWLLFVLIRRAFAEASKTA